MNSADTDDIKNKRVNLTRTIVRFYSFAIAVMLVGLGFFISGVNERKKLERENDAVYSRAFSELAGCICSINSSLEKMTYTTNPEQIAAISADIFRQVEFSKSNLGQLPINDIDITNMQTFLSQSGDYAYSLTQKAVKQEPIADKDFENLNILSDYSKKLAEQLAAMQDGVNKSNDSGAVLKIIQSDLNGRNIPRLSNFNEAEQIFADYPQIIYDGPFSSDINARQYKMLEGQDEISIDEAKTKAAEFCGEPESKLKSAGKTENSFIDTYNFECGNKFIQISQKGGYVVNYLADRQITNQLMSDADAINAANAFVFEQINEKITETYYVIENGMMIINFAAVQNGVILYPDLIKVGIALDNGEVLFYEAKGYLQNHTARNLPDNTVSRTEASKSVSPLLKTKSVRMAVIPSDTQTGEVYCYEFNCENETGNEYIIYVGAETGRQENVFVVTDTGKGKTFK